MLHTHRRSHAHTRTSTRTHTKPVLLVHTEVRVTTGVFGWVIRCRRNRLPQIIAPQFSRATLNTDTKACAHVCVCVCVSEFNSLPGARTCETFVR